MYRLTIFNENGVVDTMMFDEYPESVNLEPGQWIDICRTPIDEFDIENHIFGSEDDYLSEYMLGEIEEDEYGRLVIHGQIAERHPFE